LLFAEKITFAYVFHDKENHSKTMQKFRGIISWICLK